MNGVSALQEMERDDLTPPCEDTVRRRSSANQEAGPDKTPKPAGTLVWALELPEP